VKCIHCHTDSKYAARTNRSCPKCQHQFAFEPKAGDPLTDGAFQAALERISSGGTVRFTDRNLYYEIVRRTQHRSKALPWVLAALAVFSLLLGVFASAFFFFPAGLLSIATIITWPGKLAKLSFTQFSRHLGRWNQVHGVPKGLIVRKEPAQGPLVRALPPDIQHYSFDRAVVTDRAETVDLLLANNFHFENNCAVLSVDGYPEPAFDVVRGMLKNNPKLAVYVLHDATPKGCSLAGHLATNDWFQPSASIVDVGLAPEHARPFRGCWQVAGEWTAASGAGWLAHYSLELAVVRPEQIIKRLFRALSNTDRLVRGGGELYFVDSGAFSSDASASDGGGDSFG